MKYVVEKGPIEVPLYLVLLDAQQGMEHEWSDDEDRATRFDTSDEATAFGSNTRVEALRVTELEA
jgi:hypothetical protein